MKVLVTGGDGFVGRALVAHLEMHGDEVWTLDRHTAHERSVMGDVRDAGAMRAVLAEVRPDAVYHLAAVSFGPTAERDVGTAAGVTVGGTLTTLEACRQMAAPPLVLIPSSGEVYGPKPGSLTEFDAAAPSNSYGYTKLAQEAVALAYDRAKTLAVAIARSFNHIGPGQSQDFVLPGFAAQLADIASGRLPPVVRTGNLDAVRDFTDVRDVVAAYRLMVVGRHTGRPLNVASGSGVRIGDLLEALVEISGLEVGVEVDRSLVRAGERASVVGDATQLRELTGWRPTIPLRRTLEDVWQDALARRDARPEPAHA